MSALGYSTGWHGSKSVTISISNQLKPFDDRIVFHDVLPTNISSTRIRMMIQKKEPLNDVVPVDIIPLIESYGSGENDG